MFSILKSQLYVLRVIALHAPHVHLAFLFYEPYRAMYYNQGQNIELCERNGDWIYQPGIAGYYEKVFFRMRHNRKVYHPRISILAITSNNNVLKRILFKQGYTGLRCMPNDKQLVEGIYGIRGGYSEVYYNEEKEDFTHWLSEFERIKLLCKK